MSDDVVHQAAPQPPQKNEERIGSSMLTPPDISDDTIIACLHDAFGLRIAQLTFLPLGWVNNAVYRAVADTGVCYFLKLRRGSFDESAITLPAFLHAQGIRQVMAPIATTACGYTRTASTRFSLARPASRLLCLRRSGPHSARR